MVSIAPEARPVIVATRREQMLRSKKNEKALSFYDPAEP